MNLLLIWDRADEQERRCSALSIRFAGYVPAVIGTVALLELGSASFEQMISDVLILSASFLQEIA
jgi:hypothetical protein